MNYIFLLLYFFCASFQLQASDLYTIKMIEIFRLSNKFKIENFKGYSINYVKSNGEKDNVVLKINTDVNIDVCRVYDYDNCKLNYPYEGYKYYEVSNTDYIKTDYYIKNDLFGKNIKDTSLTDYKIIDILNVPPTLLKTGSVKYKIIPDIKYLYIKNYFLELNNKGKVNNIKGIGVLKDNITCLKTVENTYIKNKNKIIDFILKNNLPINSLTVELYLENGNEIYLTCKNNEKNAVLILEERFFYLKE